MKFTGQLKIPDLDAPGVPAAVLIDENQTEIMVQGESLGRWSLVDVRAERLVSSAFSLKLDGEEVTFIADEPTDFAYRGVEHMAKVWARYKTMTLPRRTVASARSRKGTKVSRIGDLRTAIEETLAGETLSMPTQGRVPGETAVAPPPTHRVDAPATAPADRSKPVWEPGPAETEVSETVAPESESREVERSEPQSLQSSERESSQVEPVSPEPSTVESQPVLGRHEATDSSADGPLDTDDPSSLDQRTDETPSETEERPAAIVESAEPESVFKETVPWAKTEPLSAPPESTDSEPVEPAPVEPAPVEPVHFESETAATESDPTVQPIGQPPGETVSDSGEAVLPTKSEPEPAAAVPWIDPSATAETVGQVPTTREPVDVDAAVLSKDQPGNRDSEKSDRPVEPSARPEQEPKYVVDLGAFEDRGLTPAKEVPSDEPEPALAVAKEKAGIMGAVRSAFVRNREEHEHEYVQAPGGLGIVRQICTECGHISIGMAE